MHTVPGLNGGTPIHWALYSMSDTIFYDHNACRVIAIRVDLQKSDA
jgi:hypothetical protein